MNRSERRRKDKLKNKHGSPKRDALQNKFNEAIQHHANGRLSAAEQLCREILKADPKHAGALHLTGLIALQTGHFQDAVNLLSRAVNVAPMQANTHFALGNALQNLGRFDEAKASFERTLAIAPNNFYAHNNLGNVLKIQGRFEGAIESYRKAISLKPDYVEAHRHLASTKKHTSADDPDIKLAERLYNSKDITNEQRIHLAFTLGKAYEDLKQFEIAFSFYDQANTLKRKSYPYDIEDAEAYFKTLKAIFTPELINTFKDVAPVDQVSPVFIVGMPRSGTSLVEQILSIHTDIYSAGELKDLVEIVSTYFGGTPQEEFAQMLGANNNQNLLNAARAYRDVIKRHSFTHRYVTDKMPHNFELIGLIRILLPDAKIVHCRRNPMDTGLSLYKNFFSGDSYHYAYDMTEIGRYISLYQDLMAYWHELLPGFIYDLHYEDAVEDQEGETRALLEFLDLPWDDRCLEFYKAKRPVRTASFAQVRQPIYKDSVKAWKRFEKQLEPLQAALKRP